MKHQLNEETFRFETLDQNKQEKIFDIFKSSYEASVGTSWTKDKFYGRAKNWLFFGDDNGFVTVRPQQSGLYKLTGVAGNLKSILKGLEELQQLNVPVWGMVSKDIQTMANKKGLKTPPGFLVKIMLGFIPKSTFGGVDFDINSDGSVTMKYEDVGDAKKYFVGNDLYFKQIKKDLYPKIKEKISDLPLLARKSIELFLNESKQEIDMNEDITSGSVIVYHRTGSKGGSPVEGISADGYRVGSGAAYGIGVYTTYDLESQLNHRMSSTYGSIIIESKVLSLDKFLIFDYDIAKKIYGNKNYTLSRQLRIILGNDFKNQVNQIKKLEERLGVVKYTSELAGHFYLNYSHIIERIRGIIFTGQSDGKVLISYDRKNVEPIRYTTNDGKTWTNILNKNIYQRQKDYKIDNDTYIQHLRNKLDIVGPKNLNYNEFSYLLEDEKSTLELYKDNKLGNLFLHFKSILDKRAYQFYISILNKYGIRYENLLTQYTYFPDSIDIETFYEILQHKELIDLLNKKNKIGPILKNIKNQGNKITEILTILINNDIDVISLNIEYNLKLSHLYRYTNLDDIKHIPLKKLILGERWSETLDSREFKEEYIDQINKELNDFPDVKNLIVKRIIDEYYGYYGAPFDNIETIFKRFNIDIPSFFIQIEIEDLMDHSNETGFPDKIVELYLYYLENINADHINNIDNKIFTWVFLSSSKKDLDKLNIWIQKIDENKLVDFILNSTSNVKISTFQYPYVIDLIFKHESLKKYFYRVITSEYELNYLLNINQKSAEKIYELTKNKINFYNAIFNIYDVYKNRDYLIDFIINKPELFNMLNTYVISDFFIKSHFTKKVVELIQKFGENKFLTEFFELIKKIKIDTNYFKSYVIDTIKDTNDFSQINYLIRSKEFNDVILSDKDNVVVFLYNYFYSGLVTSDSNRGKIISNIVTNKYLSKENLMNFIKIIDKKYMYYIIPGLKNYDDIVKNYILKYGIYGFVDFFGINYIKEIVKLLKNDEIDSIKNNLLDNTEKLTKLFEKYGNDDIKKQAVKFKEIYDELNKISQLQENINRIKILLT